MPRTKEFNEGDVLDKAMHLFWEKGFARTSVRDLVSHTGVAHAGLYSVFEDKMGLFKQALERYSSKNDESLLPPLEQKTSNRRSIENLFDDAVNKVKRGHFENGCFLVNSACEFGEESVEVNQIVNRSYIRQKKAFENAIANGKAVGEIPSHTNVDELSDLMVAVLNGISTMVRSGLPVEAVENAVNSIKLTLR